MSLIKREPSVEIFFEETGGGGDREVGTQN